MFRGLLSMESTTRDRKRNNYWYIQIVIMPGTQTIEKAHQAICFYWEAEQFPGILESNLWSPCHTTEAEFVAATVCVSQGIWLGRILSELGASLQKRMIVFCDNTSTIKLSKNSGMHGRSKHIDVRFHFSRNLSKDGIIELVHYGSVHQLSDTFERLRKQIGMCRLSELN